MRTSESSSSDTFTHHLAAAKALSNHLDGLGIRHAFIGGFAWSQLGSLRATEINVLIESKEVWEVREKIMGADGRFADVNLKLYYVTEDSDGHLVQEELVRNSTNNVLVETLPTGYFGLPESIVSTLEAGELGIHILHPSILILTKFKRWSTTYTSTRPKTIRKTASDLQDIRFIIDYLFEHRECIGFGDYVGKSKPELLAMLRKYHDKYVEGEEHIGRLRSIMPDDWDDMLALSAPEQEESTLPP